MSSRWKVRRHFFNSMISSSISFQTLQQPALPLSRVIFNLETASLRSNRSEKCFGLSETEHSRLARAFYHIELYGDLFYERETFHDSISPEGQSTLFLQRLRD